MRRVFQVALAVAGCIVFAGNAGAADSHVPASLTAFGADSPIPSAAALPAGALEGPSSRTAEDLFSAAPTTIATSFGTVTPPQNFAASVALSADLAVDTGYGVDLSQRFDDYDGFQSPLIGDAGSAGLASGGHYLGATYMPSSDLHVRLGASQWTDRNDHLAYEPGIGLPMAFDNARSQSVLAGASWDVNEWAGFDVTAVQNSQQGLDAVANMAAGKTTTNALDVSAQLKLGNGWVTTASYGLSQLDQRSQAPAATLDSHSYAISIAKHGLFGGDTLGFSFSRPSPGVIDNGFSAVTASGDLPPMFVANDRFTSQTRETDLQLGYVTSFFDGALALQANAAYQMNYQGQSGATSLSLLSHAKIKF
ncbi:MAG TPA: hypothetical protein VKB67_10160 [Rhizomicrobium sp.]|nr:hypothetical protein [Rhizomicrobium sp.]